MSVHDKRGQLIGACKDLWPLCMMARCIWIKNVQQKKNRICHTIPTTIIISIIIIIITISITSYYYCCCCYYYYSRIMDLHDTRPLLSSATTGDYFEMVR